MIYTVQYSFLEYNAVQNCAVKYSYKMAIIGAEMDSLTLKTYEKTYNMPIVGSFTIILFFVVYYSTVQYSNVQYSRAIKWLF